MGRKFCKGCGAHVRNPAVVLGIGPRMTDTGINPSGDLEVQRAYYCGRCKPAHNVVILRDWRGYAINPTPPIKTSVNWLPDGNGKYSRERPRAVPE